MIQVITAYRPRRQRASRVRFRPRQRHIASNAETNVGGLRAEAGIGVDGAAAAGVRVHDRRFFGSVAQPFRVRGIRLWQLLQTRRRRLRYPKPCAETAGHRA
jgi:hypothetical protein